VGYCTCEQIRVRSDTVLFHKKFIALILSVLQI
jgi:hypothetical protein